MRKSTLKMVLHWHESLSLLIKL